MGNGKRETLMDGYNFELWLNIATDGNAELVYQLIKAFGSAEGIYNAEARDIYKKVKDIEDSRVDMLCDKSMDKVKECISFCERFNVRIVTQGSSEYPERLSMIFNPPRLLYFMGNEIDIDDNVCISVVGTRSCSSYGLASARKLSYELTKQGAIIISGIAQGIDAAAHRACLEAGGVTVAVLGSGLATAYPAVNRELYKEVLKSGLLITEYPPYSPPDKTHFPIRNRIISGLSLGVLVVECSTRSGALITARHALRQGKLLYAIPSKINDYSSSGNIELIKNGAKVVSIGADIIEDFELTYPHRVNTDYKVTAPLPIDTLHEEPKPKAKKENAPMPEAKENVSIENMSWYGELTPTGQSIANALREKNMTADELMKLGILLDELLTELTLMEILGAIEAVPGGFYKLKY